SGRPLGHEQPGLRAVVPGASVVVAETCGDVQSCAGQPGRDLRDRQRTERQLERPRSLRAPAALDEPLIEDREPAAAALANGLDQRHVSPAAATPAAQPGLARVLLPGWQVRDEL